MRCFVLGEIRVLVLYDLSGSIIHYILLMLSLSSGGSAAPKKSLDV